MSVLIRREELYRSIPLAVRLDECAQQFQRPVPDIMRELVVAHHFTPTALTHFLGAIALDETVAYLRQHDLPILHEPVPAPPQNPHRSSRSSRPRAPKRRSSRRRTRQHAPEGKPLTPEMSRLLARRGEPGVVDAITMRNIGLARWWAEALCYRAVTLEVDDLAQEGYLALRRAVETYDPTRGYAFSTYISHCIRRRLSSVILDQDRIVRIPRGSRCQLIARITQAQDRHFALHGQMPTDWQISRMTGMSVDTIRQTLPILQYRSVPIATVARDAARGYDADGIEVVREPGTHGAEADGHHTAEHLYHEAYLRQHDILAAMRGTVLRCQAYVCRNLGLCTLPVESLKELSQEAGVTRNAIFQTRNRAFRRAVTVLGVSTVEALAVGTTIRAIEAYITAHQRVAA